METRFYILGTLRQPTALLRRSRGGPDPPFCRFDPAVPPDGDFVPSWEAGQFIIGGDTLLTEIPPDQVDDVRAKIRIRNRGTKALE